MSINQIHEALEQSARVRECGHFIKNNMNSDDPKILEQVEYAKADYLNLRKDLWQMITH